MTRRCSHCGTNGHNSRTCPGRTGGGGGGVKLFGVRITEGVAPMKKSFSMGCLSSATSAVATGASPNQAGPSSPDQLRDHASGYASDDPTHASCSSNCRSERKKGIPWTEEEHRMFLVGLQKLGKGDWRGIARNFVVSRTPTQVASHAQKYFIRQTNATKRKRRSSLFDMVPEMPMDELPVQEEFMLSSTNEPHENPTKLPSAHNCLDEQSEHKETFENPPVEAQENIPYSTLPLPIPVVPFYSPFVPVPLPFWPPPTMVNPMKSNGVAETHEVLKPTPVLPKEPINVDEVVGMSKLSIGETSATGMEPSALSLELLGSSSSSRQSAFHINPSIGSPDLSQSKTNAIHAV
ncbi:transcription factor MYBS3-like [Dioscorea cayenensis subsp. rotundata]|uniref:Transcription factor MYBS3-like n=1 Tax=Dioscorea cayennensis subsp. rotundata TaxID=55577 RepID=A0AB40CYH3_DIOCR|nr:transcription factor MYBS3-like [Dioscorea cayenensis subsp. rotundata]